MKLLDLQNWGIQRRVMVLAMMPLVTISVLLGTYMISERVQTAYLHLDERGKLLAAHLAPSAEFPLFSGNIELLRNLANNVANEPDVEMVRILDANREEVIRVANGSERDEKVEDKDRDILTFEYPIGKTTFPVVDFETEFVPPPVQQTEQAAEPAAPVAKEKEEQKILGWAVVNISTKSLQSREAEIIINGVLLIGVGLFLSAFLALRIGESVVEPMLRLVETVMRLRNGELDARVEVRSGGEIGLLEEWINAMAFRMQASQQALQYKVNDATRELRQAVQVLEEKNYDLEIARKEALAASRVKTDFLANMSHEIRTPLNAVIGYTRLLQETKLTREQRDYSRTIGQSASLLVSVIDDILNFSKLESGKIEMENISFDLHVCMEDMISMLSPAAHEKRLEIALLIHSEVPACVFGDPTRLSQIMANFVNNAIKFTQHGGITVQISVEREEAETTYIRFSVADTGIGLRDEEKANLFKPFSQADSSISRRFGGTGLGLSICKHLVSMMGGSIGVESEHDVGSNFWAVVPLKIETDKEREHETALQDLKLLVCDSHPFSRRAVRNTLLRLSANVFTTGDFERLQPMLAKAANTEQPYQLLVLGLSADESESPIVRDVLSSVRIFYEGPLLILVSSHTCDEAECVEEDSLVSIVAKPARRDALLMNIRRLIDGTVCDLYEPEQQMQAATTDFLPGLRVLAAEDNVFNRSLIETYLNKIGITPALAENGKEAFELASQHEFDLVLLDIHMPIMDGIQAAAKIRKLDNENRNVPIVAMTADVFVKEDKQVDTQHFTDYLFKPLKSEELVQVIHRQISQERLDVCRSEPEEGVAVVPVAEEKKEAAPKGETVNPDIPEHLIEKLMEELPVQLENLVDAYRQQDILLMREHAHQLYGLCGYFGVQSLGETTRLLQDALHDEDMEKISAHLEVVSQTIAEIVSGEQLG